MRNNGIWYVAGAACIVGTLLTGCGNTQSGEQVAMAKAQPAFKDNPDVPTEVKAQVETAKQGEVQKMNQYAKEMSEKYKTSPPAAK
ncbi:MAG: hypothetical protein H8F28_14150 [Fibrella sp.]|nr:hypothetical protein [Armatimonadota bacterium]